MTTTKKGATPICIRKKTSRLIGKRKKNSFADAPEMPPSCKTIKKYQQVPQPDFFSILFFFLHTHHSLFPFTLRLYTPPPPPPPSPTMPDAFESFFNIRELVEHLAMYLAIKDVSRLARTCKKMHMRCTPSLFKTLTVDDSNFRLFESTPALRALSQNSQHVRELNLQLYGLIFYYNCLLTFQDITSHLSDTPPTRPSWLPSPDNHASQLVALPPMTRLSRLTVDVSSSNHRPYKLSSANNAAGILAQLTWLTSLSPCLTSLSLQRVSIADMDGFRRLEDVMAGLQAIKTLDLMIVCDVNMKLAILSQLFVSCSSSIQHFRVAFVSSSGGQDDRENKVPMARRQEPLFNLKELSVWGIQHWNSAADIRSLFAY